MFTKTNQRQTVKMHKLSTIWNNQNTVLESLHVGIFFLARIGLEFFTKSQYHKVYFVIIWLYDRISSELVMYLEEFCSFLFT